MTLSRFLLLIIGISTAVSAQSLSERYTHLGEMHVPSFSSSPFPHPKRATGHTYGDRTFPAEMHYYDSSVAIFIPKGFVPRKTIDFVFYFHGWYNSIDSACMQFRLVEQFTESGKNAVFVFPEGPKDAPDSYGGRMEEKDGLKNLVADVLKYLKRLKTISSGTVGNIILAGHSGAYRVIAFCLMRGGLTPNISDVILFDALYGHTEKYSYWIDRFNGRFINIYTNDGGTKNESENLMGDLDGWKIPYRMFEDTVVTQSDLRTNRVTFIHTELSHNDVIATKNQFRDFLSTSRLRNKQ